MVGHPGAAPGVSPIRTARIAVFLMPDKMNEWIRHADLHRALRHTSALNRCLFVGGMSVSEIGGEGGSRTRCLRDAIALLYC